MADDDDERVPQDGDCSYPRRETWRGVLVNKKNTNSVR